MELVDDLVLESSRQLIVNIMEAVSLRDSTLISQVQELCLEVMEGLSSTHLKLPIFVLRVARLVLVLEG
jgi:hypothetical protein